MERKITIKSDGQYKNIALIWSIIIVIIALTLSACSGGGDSGGTIGTGGIKISGRVVGADGTPQKEITLTLVSSGDAVQTDDSGNFELEGDDSSSQNIVITNGTKTVNVEIKNIPSNALVVNTTITVRFDDNPSASADDVRVTQTRPSPTPTPNNGGSGDDDGTPDQGGSNDDDDSSDDNGGSDSGDDDDDDNDDDSNSTPSPSPSSSPSPTPTPQGQEVETTGNITALSSSSVTVNGLTFVINGSTELKDKDNEDTTISTFKVGDRVKVEGVRISGVLTATEMKIR